MESTEYTEPVYDLFISHCEKDKEFAINLKTHLEEYLGFICLLAYDDFPAGRTVLGNIERAITSSKKVLFIVSEDFLQSAYCKRETDFAFTHAASMQLDNYIIVLKLGSFDDSQLPLRYRALTYIDGFGKSVEEIGEKLQFANANVEDNILPIPEPEPIPEPDNCKNGKEVFKRYPTEMSRNWWNLECEFKDITENERTTFESFDLQVDACVKSYSSLQHFVLDRWLLRKYALILSSGKCTCLFCLIVFGTIMISLAITAFISLGSTGDVSVLQFSAGFVGVIVQISFGVYRIYLAWYSHQVKKSLLKAAMLNINYRENNFFIIPTHTKRLCGLTNLSISIFFYDMKPCWDFIEAKARQQWPMASSDDIRVLCENELSGAIKKYYQRPLECPIPPAIWILHPTYQASCCLCQLAESPWVLHTSGMEELNEDSEQTELMKVIGDEEYDSQSNLILSEVVDTPAIPVPGNAVCESTSVKAFATNLHEEEETSPNSTDLENMNIFSSLFLPSSTEESSRKNAETEETELMKVIGVEDYDSLSNLSLSEVGDIHAIPVLCNAPDESTSVKASATSLYKEEETSPNNTDLENMNSFSSLFLPSSTEESSRKNTANEVGEETCVMKMTGHDIFGSQCNFPESEVGDKCFSSGLENAIEGNVSIKISAPNSSEAAETSPNYADLENINVFHSFSLPLNVEEISMQDFGNCSAKEDK